MTGAAGRVVCLGDVMLDVLALLPGPLVTGSDRPAPISIGHGGSAANTAAWLASLGNPAVFAGRVGADDFGRAAVELLQQQGVQTRVSIDPVAATGICLVLVGPDGERTMVPSAGANARLTVAELTEPPLLAAGDRLHLSGYPLLHPGSRTAALAALAMATELDLPISVDAASAAPIRQLGGQRFLDWLPAGSLLLANADELAALSDDDPAAPASLVARGLTVVVKRGPAGALVASPDTTTQVGTEPVQVLDSTGAGDAFAAGLLAALHRGADLLTAVQAANRTGALALTRLGGRPG